MIRRPHPSWDRRLRRAIAEKRLVELGYHGHRRVVEPHDYGMRNGRVMLLVYQVCGGSSRASPAQGWRLLDVTKITDCTVLAETFAGSRRAPHQRHYAWDTVYARVE